MADGSTWISSGGNLLSSAINSITNAVLQKKQNEFNAQQAEAQNQFNLDMWNKQNEYNSPSSQMERLVEAGLSPNLAYGNVSSGNNSSAPEQVAPSKGVPNMAFNVGGLTQLALAIQNQVEKNKAIKLDNLEKASRLASQEAIGLNNINADYSYSSKTPLWKKQINRLLGRSTAGLKEFNYKIQDALMATPELRNQIMSGNVSLYPFRRALLSSQTNINTARNLYQNMLNNWFKADRIFNYSNGFLNTISHFIPKANFNIHKGGYNNQTLHSFIK